MARRLEGENAVLTCTDGRERCGIYARFSSFGQSKASIDDQITTCRDTAAEMHWVILDPYIMWDEGKTGKSIAGRKGIQALIALAKAKPRLLDRIILDDSSRLGRNMGDVFKTLDIFEHYGVHLYFANDELDTKSEWFRDAFTAKARADEQSSKTHGKRVKRGRRGRFEAGYNPGGGCYGYKNVRIEDPTGRPGAIHGMKQVIDPEQREIVFRIFRSYAEGRSYFDIAKMLNEEGVPPPQSARTKLKPSWSKHAIQHILGNERYHGKVIWGRTFEVHNPETGQRERRDVPEAEWKTRYAPDLMIVGDDLWDQVQSLRELKSKTIGVQSSGGMSRTEASRRYLFSGLLKCGARNDTGTCNGNIVIRTTQPPRYGCANHTDRDTCDNRVTVKLEDLEREFLAALSANLRSEGLREELVQAIYEHLRSAKSQRLSAESNAGADKKELEMSLRTQGIHLANLVNAIKESGGSRTLYQELAVVEARISRIEEILAATTKPVVKDIRIEEVREFVNGQSDHFEILLLGSPEALKLEFQSRISKITLVPKHDERGPIYEVTGDVDLFSIQESGVKTNHVHLVGLHHTIPVSCQVVCYRNHQTWSMPEAA
jgi:site-specific DNA recombinase